MISGAKFWNDRDTFYIQTNNPTEQLLKKREKGGWLESCGPTAAVNCLAARGENLEIKTPGSYRPQPEEVLLDYFNDPRNKSALEGARILDGEIPGNRVPQFYPIAVFEVFDVKARFCWRLSFSIVAGHIIHGSPVQICLKRPRHYIAVVAYDIVKNELIYNDSWPDRFPDKEGFNRRMTEAEFSSNVESFFIVY